MAMTSLGPKRSIRYELMGNSAVWAMIKKVSVHCTASRRAWNTFVRSVVKSVHAYCKFATASIATMQGSRIVQRDWLWVSCDVAINFASTPQGTDRAKGHLDFRS